MIDYRIYRISGLGKIAGAARELTYETDEDAIRDAQMHCLDLSVEVWQGARRVAKVSAFN